MGSKFLNVKCPRCKTGRLYLDTYERPPDIACIQCGWRHVAEESTHEAVEDKLNV